MTRRGFTLIELVVSLSVVGILITAIGSSIVVATRSLPTSGGLAETQASTGRALMLVGEDIRLATTATILSGRRLDLTLSDRTDDAASEAVSYSWSGTSGDPLVRSFNGVDNELVSTISDFDVSSTARASFDADGRTTNPADRIVIEITTLGVEPVSVTGEFRLLNTRVP
ncbi:MAG: prepilin-type N-terminal cleavage/methylation domain-containing protein [Phycisphaera sp.]|nr:MAG: prepilin-type N-terminal cleavage/methylation domain-containing protein [Phycisphaera sp.]